ncbi:unnamed protein product [Symbiodinium necroappetens]|uniref:CSD domain-containing protein n=1 Tax=Symbiodinium necroappetens TaxID=1628268 RepID=A0A812ZWZ5_9DINO|nr:unnamed protein product [Symbiodinium necroappetens]
MDSPPPQRKAAGFVPPPGLGSPMQEPEAMQRRPEDMAGANVPGRGLDQAMADYAFQHYQSWSPPNAGKGSAGYGNRAMPAGPSRAPGAHLAPQPGAGMPGSAGSGKGSAVAQSALQSLQMFQGSDGRGAEETSAMQRAAAEQLQKQRMAEARNDPDAQRSAAENAALENARRLKNSPLVQDLASRNANVSKGKEEKRYSGILKVFRPEHGWGFIENPELKNKFGHVQSQYTQVIFRVPSDVHGRPVLCAEGVGPCSCELYPIWGCCRPQFQEVNDSDDRAEDVTDGTQSHAPQGQSPILRYRARSKEPHAIKLCGLTAPRLIQAFVWRVANISVKAVQVRRVEALIISLILVALGVVLTLVTLVGGLSRGVLLERFGWITLANGPEFRYLGMRFACLSEGSLRSPAFAERWSGNHDRCVPLNALACPVEEQLRSERFSKSGFSLQLERVQCSACRNATAVLLLPILITMATYVKLIQGTTARLMWRDTAINKVLLVLSGIIGGIANLGLMAIYHGTCITTLRRAELFLQPELGPGFGCLLLATVCKMLAALLNLCLGVHRQDVDPHPDVCHDVFLNQAVEGGIKLGSLVSFTLEMSKDGKPQARNARMEAEKVDRPKTSAPGQEARELVGKVFKGRVKSFNATNGFGFLTCEELKSKFNGRDIYVNHTQVPGGGPLISGQCSQLSAVAVGFCHMTGGFRSGARRVVQCFNYDADNISVSCRTGCWSCPENLSHLFKQPMFAKLRSYTMVIQVAGLEAKRLLELVRSKYDL